VRAGVPAAEIAIMAEQLSTWLPTHGGGCHTRRPAQWTAKTCTRLAVRSRRRRCASAGSASVKPLVPRHLAVATRNDTNYPRTMFRRLPLSLLITLGALGACGDDPDDAGGDDGTRDASSGSSADAASGGPAADASASADAGGQADAAAGADGGDADGGTTAGCPPPAGGSDGLTLAWLKGVLSGGGAARLIAVDAAPDCSFVVGGLTFGTGPVVFGQGEPDETTLDSDGPTGFVARYRADGTFDWVVDVGPIQLGLQTLSLHVMDDGTTAVVGDTGISTRRLTRVSPDGEVVGEPATVDGNVVLPRPDGGLYVAHQQSGLERRSADGEVMWRRSIGSYPETIVELDDGRVLVGGGYETQGVTLSFGFPDQVVIDTANDGCYAALYGPDGSLEWVRHVDVDGNLVPNCGAAAADEWVAMWLQYPNPNDREDFIVYPGDGPPIVAAGLQAMVIRYELDGGLAWFRGITTATEDDTIVIQRPSFSVDPGAGGMVTLGGQLDGTVLFATEQFPSSYTLVTSEENQGFFARYAADGTLSGVREFSSAESGDSWLEASATRADGAVIAVGEFSGTLVIDPFELAPGSAYGFLFVAH